MPNTYRHVRGNHQPTLFTTKTGIDYYIGDAVYVDTGDSNTIKPAGSFTWDTNLATTQESFVDVFAGVMCQAALAAQAGRKLVVATKGVFRFDCAALGAAKRAGTLFGMAKQTGNLLEPQKVAEVATNDLAVGRLAEDAPSGATEVLIEITSAVIHGGVMNIP